MSPTSKNVLRSVAAIIALALAAPAVGREDISHANQERQVAQAAPPAGRSSSVPRGNASGFACGTKRVCGDMSSCAEARFHFEQCGMSKLDRDHDGVPCETICR